LSLQTTIFPDDWKLAKITPVFKDGNKNDCGNYRPISVISVVAKIFEKLVYQQLKSFMTVNNILVGLNILRKLLCIAPQMNGCTIFTRKYMNAETLALLTVLIYKELVECFLMNINNFSYQASC
jgi:hypothetical protein